MMGRWWWWQQLQGGGDSDNSGRQVVTGIAMTLAILAMIVAIRKIRKEEYKE